MMGVFYIVALAAVAAYLIIFLKRGDCMDIGQLLGSYAFPIVMCLLMYKQQNDMAERHREEAKELRESLDNNTLVIQRLIDNMEEK